MSTTRTAGGEGSHTPTHQAVGVGVGIGTHTPHPRTARDLDNTLSSFPPAKLQQLCVRRRWTPPQQQPGFIPPLRTTTNTPLPGCAVESVGAAGVCTDACPGAGRQCGWIWRGWTQSPMPLALTPMRLPSLLRDRRLIVPLPSLPVLTTALPAVTGPVHDPALQLAWVRDVLFFVDRSLELASGPLAQAAVPLVLGLWGHPTPLLRTRSLRTSSPNPSLTPLLSFPIPTNPLPGTPPPAEALYLRATFASAAAWPAFAVLVPRNPRAAFRDFETAARGGV
ncbi:hypothetical protein B0H11DRAFT_2235243 [Mycena galericulata]|nr:hypothetical protein B0H11DRAFT_2235243 [Mycena galericulata]